MTQYSSNSSVHDSAGGGSNISSPVNGNTGRPKNGALVDFNHTPKSEKPNQTPQPAKLMVTPTSASKSGNLFRFSKEQRAILERSATLNMSPSLAVKQRLAQEIDVDVKKVTVGPDQLSRGLPKY